MVKDVSTAEPLVSIIMNCYNGERYLREAIDSILAQTYQNWEVVFWDNQSTDRSAEIFQSYSDSRLKYYRAPVHSEKLYDARNKAYAHVNGQLIAFLDVDDWWLPEKLELQVDCFKDPDVGVVCSDYWVYNIHNGRRRRALNGPAPQGWVLDELLQRYFVGLLTLVVRKAAVDSLDYPFNGNYHIIGDFDFVVRLAVSWKLICVPEPEAFFRLHGQNMTVVRRAENGREIMDWVSLMEARGDEIFKSPSFRRVVDYGLYIYILSDISSSKMTDAHLKLELMSWGRLRFRAMVAFIVPRRLWRMLRA